MKCQRLLFQSRTFDLPLCNELAAASLGSQTARGEGGGGREQIGSLQGTVNGCQCHGGN